jgi:hypothetical protein
MGWVARKSGKVGSMTKEDNDAILKLLEDIDSYAADSRGEYSNARGNDSLCYAATQKIREILKKYI